MGHIFPERESFVKQLFSAASAGTSRPLLLVLRKEEERKADFVGSLVF